MDVTEERVTWRGVIELVIIPDTIESAYIPTINQAVDSRVDHFNTNPSCPSRRRTTEYLNSFNPLFSCPTPPSPLPLPLPLPGDRPGRIVKGVRGHHAASTYYEEYPHGGECFPPPRPPRPTLISITTYWASG